MESLLTLAFWFPVFFSLATISLFGASIALVVISAETA